jgi:tRNA threonylcarbamoyladenosine biosynthesis protein TsaB
MVAAILAFDTSTETLSLALGWAGGCLVEQAEGGPRASAELLPRARAMLAQAGLAFGDLDAVAFGRGPGAFTGLRTACAAAQGLAFGAGLPVLPVDSLSIVAEAARSRRQRAGSIGSLDVGVAMDARMGELYAGCYRWTGRAWLTLLEPVLCDPAAVTRVWPVQPAVVAGSGLSLAGLTGPGHDPDDAGEEGRALALLTLACQAWDAGLGVDPAEALPVYVRDKVAATTAEREAAARHP